MDGVGVDEDLSVTLSVVVGWVGCVGFGIVPSVYPNNPFAPSSWVIIIFHCSKFSPLNFCSSGRIVKDGNPDIFRISI